MLGEITMTEVIIADGIVMEFFELSEKHPNEREMVTLVLKPGKLHEYYLEVPKNIAGNCVVTASTRIFKSVPPKFTVRTHYSTYDIVSDDVLYWGRIKQD